MKCLLVGGSSDGAVVNCSEDMNELRMRKKESLPTGIYNSGLSVQKKDFVDELYIKEALHGESDRFYLFRNSEISIDEMIYELIDNYSVGVVQCQTT